MAYASAKHIDPGDIPVIDAAPLFEHFIELMDQHAGTP